MGLWSLVIPDETVNILRNPSVELSTTGYAAMAGSIARSTAAQRRGVASLAITPAAGVNDGAYYGTVDLTINITYTFSLDVKGVAGIPYKIYFADGAGNLLGTATAFTATGYWQRVAVTYTETATNSRRVYITKNNSASVGVIYADGWMVTAKNYEQIYVDGDQEDGEWDLDPHASFSRRSGQSRAGGRLIDLDIYNVTVRMSVGSGMPPAKHLVYSQPLLSGGVFRGRSVLPRTMILTIGAMGETLEGLHSLRKDLVDAIKPDLVTGDQAITVQYTGANSNIAIEIRGVYDAGLEMGERDGFSEEIGLRLICYDPFWREIGNTAKELLVEQSVANANYIIGKVDGIWQAIAGGVDNTAYDMSSSPIPPHNYFSPVIRNPATYPLYIGGAFGNAGGPNGDYIVYWDGNAFYPLGSGADNFIRAVLYGYGPNNFLYAGGNFTHIGGVAANYIARWDGSTWYALGTGCSAQVWAMCFGLDGALYVGGQFQTAGGLTVNRIAKYSPPELPGWSVLSTGMDNYVLCLAVGKDGSLYAGGKFDTAGGTTVNRIAKWNGSAWSSLGGGMNGDVNTLAVDENGMLYAGGAFTTAGGIAANRIAKWNGIIWEPLGEGLNGEVKRIKITKSGLIYVVGAFTTAGGLATSDRVAIWNGTTWCHVDVNLPGTPTVWGCYINGEDIFFGYDTAGTAYGSYLNTVINAGTRAAYPRITFKRTGGTSAVVEWLKNETTGKILWLNYGLLNGETLTIDLDPGKRRVVSSYFGEVWRAVLRNSDLAEFSLLPGTNLVSAFVNRVDAPTVEAFMEWRNTHWSVDGVAN